MVSVHGGGGGRGGGDGVGGVSLISVFCPQ